MAVVYLMYIFVRKYWMVVGLGLTYGIGNGTYLAVDYNLANSTLPNKKEAAKDLGLWGIAACLGMMAGPLLCGPLLYYFGRTATPAHYTIQGYTVLMVLGSLVSLLSAAMVTRIKNVK
mmetsp:Transcript_67844/g.159681  ORF Transcript_67844/g.159681 Transcript_67844/m.159681 type:complete len:118 (-) Transcript_67844:25-378(-)